MRCVCKLLEIQHHEQREVTQTPATLRTGVYGGGEGAVPEQDSYVHSRF